MQSSKLDTDPLAVIAQLDPGDLRTRLARTVREATALRGLLRLAERAQPRVEDREEKAEASNGHA